MTPFSGGRQVKTSSVLGVILALTLTVPAVAQTWPAKPVTMVVGSLAGSGPDAIVRFLAERLRERTGQPFVVENRAGGFGMVGAQAVARAPADGYTVLFAPVSIAVNIHLFKNAGYDPVKDFAPVTTNGRSAFMLLVNPAAVPVSTVAELTQYIRARPGKLAWGAGGAVQRVAGELYLSLSGLRQSGVTFVSYKGSPEALNDVLGGRIQFSFVESIFGIPQTRGGQVRALAVTGAQRTSAAPEIPAMAEVGVPGYDLEGWFATFMPARAPRDTVQRLAELSNAAMTTDEAREFLRKLATDPFPGTPDSLARFLDSEIAKWGRIIREAGIAPE